VRPPTATSFPLSKHTRGGDTAPAFSGLCVYLQFTGKWVFPPLLWSFPPTATFTSFLAPDCWGVCHRSCLLQLACLFTAHVGSGSSTLCCGVFLPPPLFKLSHSWLLGMCHHSCLLQLACCKGFPFPPFQLSGCPALFAMCLFCYCLLFSFFFFFPLGGGRSVQGTMLIWPRLVCGSTTCRLAHLVVCIFSSHLGAAVWWQHGSPLGFFI
jgi:hypothetical protein